jgi:NADPH:quinone reductase-like Zn-dependent oxidoreductase
MVPGLSNGITVDCMHAISVREPGGPDVLEWTEVPDPVPGPGEVLIDVAASAVNRADLLQRQGFYPPPPGASDIIGLECSGTRSRHRRFSRCRPGSTS